MAKKQLSFSKSYEELEKIVGELESRDVDLERDLPQFERGLQLAQDLQSRLKKIENKVIAIERKYSGVASEASSPEEDV